MQFRRRFSQPSRRGACLLAACALLLGLAPRPARAAERRLSLSDCLRLALERNTAVQSAELEPLLAEADYLAAQGLFDPTVFLTITFTDRTDPLATRTQLAVQGLLTAVDSEVVIGVVGIGGVTTAGTQYNLTFERTRTESTITHFFNRDGEYDMDLTASVTQPLLKNFGVRVTTTSLQVARIERHAALARLEQALIDTLFGVERAYWSLVLAREQLAVQENGVALAQQLLDETRARLEVGVVARLAVLQAETALAQREEGVLLAEQAVGDARDELLRLVAGDATAAGWDDEIVPVDAPTVEILDVDVDRSVDTAMQRRPELAQLRHGLQQARLNTAFQRNQMLPEVNLLAEGGWGGLGVGFNAAWVDIVHRDFPHWLLGVEVNVPWGNHEARGTYRRARLTERQTESTLRQTRQLLVQDVRASTRAITSGLRRVETTRVAERLEREQMSAEETKLDVGVSTPFDVRQKQDDLLQAQSNALEALIGYRIAVASMARAEGRYLDRIGVTLDAGNTGGTGTTNLTPRPAGLADTPPSDS